MSKSHDHNISSERLYNPYLQENLTWANRKYLVKKYSWAIPDEEAINIIKRLNKPIIEIGAGTGYWAWLMQQKGVDVYPYDIEIPKKTWTKVYSDLESSPQAAYMFCWPPYDDPMAFNYLGSETVIYIGEGPGGCTADDQFHNALEENYNLILDYDIPQYEYIHDRLYIYKLR